MCMQKQNKHAALPPCTALTGAAAEQVCHASTGCAAPPRSPRRRKSRIVPATLQSAISSTASDALDLPGRRASLRAAQRYADVAGQGRGSEARFTRTFAPTAASGSQTPGGNLPSSIERDDDLRARATGGQSGYWRESSLTLGMLVRTWSQATKMLTSRQKVERAHSGRRSGAY